MAGRSVVARFSMAIEGLLHQALQLLARMKCDYAPCGDGNLLPGLRIAPRPLRLLPQLEVAEAGEFHHLAAFQGDPDFLEERLDHVFGLAHVQPDLLEHEVGQLGLGEGDFVFHVRGLALNFSRSKSRMEATTASTSESVKVLSVSCITIRRARLFWPGSTPFPRYWSNTSTSRTTPGTAARIAPRSSPAVTASATRKAMSRLTAGIRETPPKAGMAPASNGAVRSSKNTGAEASSYFCCRRGWSSPATPTLRPCHCTAAQRPG